MEVECEDNGFPGSGFAHRGSSARAGRIVSIIGPERLPGIGRDKRASHKDILVPHDGHRRQILVPHKGRSWYGYGFQGQ